MTQTHPDPRPATPAMSAGQAIGQAVGQAQSVLSRVLVEAVAQAGTERETYLALQRLGVLGDAATLDAYVRDVVDWLDMDRGSAGELADRLAAAGLITARDGAVQITTDGAQLRAQVVGLISAVTAPLYEGLSPADVDTTVRTLRGLTTGARAAMASSRGRQPAGEGEGS
jgi:DNA-binding MarR family transcriptional regulator